MNTLKRTLIIAWGVALLIVSATALAQTDAEIRFVHAFVDAPNVDIAVNGELVAEDVPFGAASDYLPVPAGDIAIALAATGTTDPLVEQTITIGADPLTLVISNAEGFIAYPDNVDALAVGQARLTAVHAVDGGPAVDVVVPDGRPIITQLEFGVPYGTLDIPISDWALLGSAVNVIPTGTDIESALFGEALPAPLATGTSYMVLVYGTLEAPQALVLARAVNPNDGDGFLQVVHNVADGPAVDVYADDQLIIPSLAEGSSTVAFPLPAGTYPVQVTVADTADIIVEGSVSISAAGTTVATVNVDGDTLVLDTEPDAPTVAAEPTQAAPTEAVVVTQVAEAVTPVPAAPTLAAEVVVQPPAAAVEEGLPTGRVLLDPGANLQLRQYPDISSLSLGLVPSGATVSVLGREGAPRQIEGLFDADIQAQIDSYVDPAEDLPPTSDLDPQNTWLQVSYTTTDGGLIEAWVLAQFLALRETDGETTRLADLPTIPANDFGESLNTEVTPPPIPDDVVSAEVYNLSPGVNLQLRRTPSISGESLALIPNGSVLEYIGYEISPGEAPAPAAATDAEWMFVRYTNPEGGTATGWVSTLYVRPYWRGELIDFEEMEARTLLLFEDPTTRGELGRDVAPPPQPTVDPLEDQIIATVILDPGANLQFRRDPDGFSESIGLIPANTQLIVQTRTEDAAWLQVTFEGQVGWISSNFVRLTFNSELFDLGEVPVAG
jgi:uncharacterized protein YgiM (DUF1202 family)